MAPLLLVGCGEDVMSVFQPEAPVAMARQAAAPADRALVQAFRGWVRQHAGGGWKPDPGKLFPSINCCEEGLEAYAMSPQGGELVVTVAKAFFDARLKSFRFDPRRHQIFLVEATNDEHELYVVVGEKASGRFQVLASRINSVDIGFMLDERFAQLFPGVDPDDMWGVLEFLYSRGQNLHLSPKS